MRADRPSQTAMATAFLRALHRVADDAPLVFDDPVAIELLPWPQRRFLERLGALPERWRRTFRQRRSGVTRMRAQVLVRARAAEDALAAARDAGIGRYVVLSAGLDTYALRHDFTATGLPVIEVDHPATQRWKHDWIVRHRGGLPAGLTLCPVDFERQTLADVLPPPSAPQFFSWLGTTYYLSREALGATLRDLAAASPPGSRLVMDFWRQAPLFDPAGAALLWGTRLATALQQEPMKTFLEPDALADLATAAGWRVAELLTARDQNARWLSGRRDGLAVPSFACLATLAID
ncbi:MAG: SAM-dependent methyltransferase [Pseudomonadales bacterium]